MSAQSWLNQIWYERLAPPWWLVPLSLLYGAVSGCRRYLYAKHLRRSTRMQRPVVIVGNLTVGGTGKTPLVCWLVARLAEQGFRPGVVTRGYGGSTREVRIIEACDDPKVVGDEPILLARRTGVPVAVGRDRPAAAQLLVGAGCDVIVSDDGLQHYALARDCEVVVIDGDRRFGNGWLLPAGPLRESRSRLSVADAVVVNGGRALLPGAFSMRLEARSAIALAGGRTSALQVFAGTQVHAVAGIGHPERFFNMLRAHGIEVLGHPLADHARLGPKDILFPDDKPVLMTEKDAVKCVNAADERHWYVPVHASFDGAESNTLLDIVTQRIANPRSRPGGTVHG
ncbi:MAG TPA: tetraacyldisaccharide 4'-kinase [Steroidobacteraceae bacterium]|nr:tetraacyldisaccharide 4'-kinase [Steroidobacteraceae bacterium]